MAYIAAKKNPHATLICSCCGETNKEYYKNSVSPLFEGAGGVLPFCKECINKDFENIKSQFDSKEFRRAFDMFCCRYDYCYDDVLITKVMEESAADGSDFLGSYIRRRNLRQYGQKTYFNSIKDSDMLANNEVIESENLQTQNLSSNLNDVVRLVGYDPFSNSDEKNKPLLYAMLVDFLDESTLEDSFKLPSVIQIVKSFVQCEEINNSINALLSSNIRLDAKEMKTLVDAKRALYSSTIALAKDNGISVNNNNDKSRGAGTLSGIIKKMQEMKIAQSNVNVFDYETAEGVLQVANLSNTSIMNQLKFDENDYTEMISEQRDIITTLREKTDKLSEENRLLKIQIKSIGGV